MSHPGPTSDFGSTQQSITEALLANTRAVTRLTGQDVDYHRSLKPNIAASLDDSSARLLKLAEKLLRRANSSAAGTSPALSDVEAVDASWPRIVDIADTLFERADTCLDEYTGLIRRHENGDRAQSASPRPRKGRLDPAFRDTEIPKPQLLFDTKPANDELEPFRPFLTVKPHGLFSLAQSLEQIVDDDGNRQYQHPYYNEITQYQYPSAVYSAEPPQEYLPFGTTKATYVDGLAELAVMLQELKKTKEIAIDLEHHDMHSYIGIVSLMQISTRNHDWIVDTLKPWRRELQILNEVFADPSIVKVLHGAHMDIIWLQRDLGLYVVGLFDTYHAARVLGYPGGSLAYLLKRFVNFDAQKQYQTADWRLRPLPSELLDYARSDTHFLLYIFDNLRNELIERSNFGTNNDDRINEVLLRSKEESLQRYEHPMYDAQDGSGRNGWSTLLAKHPSDLSKPQISVFAKLHQWRDAVARSEDESVNFVLQNNVLYNIARAIPSDTASLLAVAHPISRVLRQRVQEVLDIIQRAKLDSDDAPTMVEILTHYETQRGRKFSQTVSKLSSNTGEDHLEDSADLIHNNARASASSFWGQALQVSQREATKAGAGNVISYSIALPLVDARNDLENQKRAGKPSIVLSEAETETPLGQSDLLRNPKVDDRTHWSGSAQTVLIDDSAETALSRVQQRTEMKSKKRTRKESKKASRSEDNAVKTVADETTNADVARSKSSGSPAPSGFDYTAAPSVLHSKHMERTRRDAKSAVNPYTRAEGASSGVKRKQNYSAGRSMTFK